MLTLDFITQHTSTYTHTCTVRNLKNQNETRDVFHPKLFISPADLVIIVFTEAKTEGNVQTFTKM